MHKRCANRGPMGKKTWMMTYALVLLYFTGEDAFLKVWHELSIYAANTTDYFSFLLEFPF
jgi:hypothetical protein